MEWGQVSSSYMVCIFTIEGDKLIAEKFVKDCELVSYCYSIEFIISSFCLFFIWNRGKLTDLLPDGKRISLLMDTRNTSTETGLVFSRKAQNFELVNLYKASETQPSCESDYYDP